VANPEHLAKLKEGVAAWNQWRLENPSITPDLEHADLRHAHLEHALLSWTHFESAILFQAHLEHAIPEYAHLEHADLRHAHLEHADLREAHLEHADLSGAHLEHADLGGADLTGADVTGLSYLGLAPYRRRMMRGQYRGVQGLSSCYGNRIFVRDASDQDYRIPSRSSCTAGGGNSGSGYGD